MQRNFPGNKPTPFEIPKEILGDEKQTKSKRPIMVSIIDTEEQINKLIPYLDAMLEDGLIAISSVDVIRYSRSPVKTSEKQ